MKSRFVALTVAGAGMMPTAHAALAVVNLTAGASSAAYNTDYSIAKTLTDPFAYNPATPTIPLPVMDGGPFPGFHGDSSVNHFLQYTFSSITTGAGQTTQFVVDLWGRSRTDSLMARDNNYTITLYNGDFATTVMASPLTSITDSTTLPHHQRTVFDLEAGTTFDRFEIRATNTQYFSILETRAAFETIPEPGAALLGGLGLLGLLRRRR